MKISANEIKSGNILEVDGQLWQVLKNPEHTKPGKGGAYVQVEMKNLLKKGTKKNTRFSSTDSVEKAFLEEVERQYLYQEGEFLVVMDPETFEQSMVPASLIAEKLPLLSDGMVIKLDLYNDEPINLKLPTNMEVEVELTDPVIKGATVTSSYKPAELTCGLKVMVPPYLISGEKIVIKTEDLTFVERVK